MWLENELEKRGWSQTRLAKLSGVTRQAINAYVKQRRVTPDRDTLQGIARAFNMPVVDVYRRAGILPEQTKPIDSVSEAIVHHLKGMTDKQKRDVLEYIEFVQSKATREGITPPEVFKIKV